MDISIIFLIIFFIIVLFFIVLYNLGLYKIYGPKDIIKYIYIYINPENGSLYLVRNGKVLLDINSDKLFPLASTVKIIIAIEFAIQSSNGTLNPNEKVSVSELDKYYIKNTDGGTYKAWLMEMSKNNKIQNGKVLVRDIARGMIKFSSNANTEYLLSKLGFDNVNRVLIDLGLKKHEPLYPIVSALIVLRDRSLEDLLNLTKEEYIRLSYEVHDNIKNGKLIDINIEKDELSIEKQKIFSNWLIQGTAQEYGSILKKINNRTYFSIKEQDYIEELMKYSLNLPNISYGGEKGGNTIYISTSATYETTKDGDKTELVIFLNKLSLFQNQMYSLIIYKLKYDLLNGRNIMKYKKYLK